MYVSCRTLGLPMSTTPTGGRIVSGRVWKAKHQKYTCFNSRASEIRISKTVLPKRWKVKMEERQKIKEQRDQRRLQREEEEELKKDAIQKFKQRQLKKFERQQNALLSHSQIVLHSNLRYLT